MIYIRFLKLFGYVPGIAVMHVTLFNLIKANSVT